MSGLGELSKREFLRVIGAFGASALSPLVASAQYRELGWLPEKMKKLGFDLKEVRAINQLVVPSLELPEFDPNEPENSGRNYLTSVYFDNGSNTAQIQTSDQRTVTLEVLVDRRTINFREGSRYQVEPRRMARPLTYEPDEQIRNKIWELERNRERWILHDRAAREKKSFLDYDFSNTVGELIDHNNRTFGYQMIFDPQTGLFITRNSKTIYDERIDGISGFNIDVLLGRYLKITSKHGQKFSLNQGLDSSDWILVSFVPVKEDEKGNLTFTDQVNFVPNFGATTPIRYFHNVSSIMSEFDKRPYYGRDFRDVRFLDFGGNRLLVRGPNQWGQFELSSGDSTLLYNPRTERLELGKGWDTKSARVSIEVKDRSQYLVRADLANKDISVILDYGNNNRKVIPIQINFGNTDLDKAYSVVKK